MKGGGFFFLIPLIFCIIGVINNSKTKWIMCECLYLYKKQKATINPVNSDDDKCFPYVATVELN